VFEAARAALLPEGYPGSVRPEYLRFQVYDTIQAACSYLRAILSTGAILKASGVGEAAASPMAAAVAWVLRDGFGMCGSLLFASLVGVGFDENVKEWRLFADLINDVGLTLNMLAPMAGERFFLVAALGSTCTSICGMVAGATRASITAHFALSGNLADVSAKEGAQETAVTLVGLVVGSYLFAPLVGEAAPAVWTAFALLTALHVYANWQGVGCLALLWLNRHRAVLASRDWAASAAPPSDAPPEALSPAALSRLERPWGPFLSSLQGPRLGARLPHLCASAEDVCALRDAFAGERYWLRLDPAGRAHVMLSAAADGEDALRALLHSALCAGASGGAAGSGGAVPLLAAERRAIEQSRARAEAAWPKFSSALLEAGWEAAALRNPPLGWRFTCE